MHVCHASDSYEELDMVYSAVMQNVPNVCFCIKVHLFLLFCLFFYDEFVGCFLRVFIFVIIQSDFLLAKEYHVF